MPDLTPIDAIRVGDRIRTDMGDISELARSIKEIGLLHPVVVTTNLDLIAGGRRLEAVRSLGWTSVPTTTVTWFDLATKLQAEAEENTCRKGLTPYEASVMRERRIEALRATSEIRPARRPSRSEEKSSNLDDFQAAPSERAARKVGAQTTGYSGSTLDKVDRIRDIAERGVVRQGKTEVPAPEPVVEVARQALADVKVTGAAIDRSSRNVEAAVEAYVAQDADVRRARYAKSFARVLNAFGAITEFAAEDVAALIDPEQWEDALRTHRVVNEWFTKVREARPARLRVVGGK